MIPEEKLEKIKTYINGIPWRDLLNKYAQTDYILVGFIWLFSASFYFPIIYNAFGRMLNETGGPLLFVAVIVPLELAPFGILWLCIKMIESGKAVQARLVAALPAMLATVGLQTVVLAKLNADVMRGFGDAVDKRGLAEERGVYSYTPDDY